MKENFDNVNQSNQNINISKGGDDGMSTDVEKVMGTINKEGFMAATKIFPVEIVTQKNIEDFNRWKDVWEKENLHDGNMETITEHYGEYDEQSTDIISYTNPETFGEKTGVGTVRIIWNGEKGTPALNDFQIEEAYEWLKKEKCAEFTLVTVGEKWRKKDLMHLPSLILYREACRQIKNGGTDNIMFITDKRIRDAFQNHIGFIVHKISKEEPASMEEERKMGGKREKGEKWYEGDWCAAYYINYSESLENLKKVNPPLYEFFKV